MKTLIALALKRQQTMLPSIHLINYSTNKSMDFLNCIICDFLLIGGHAVCLYGYSRQTKDIDILINIDDKDICHDNLISSGAIFVQDLGIKGKSYIFNNEQLDVLYSDDEWFTRAFTSSQEANDIKVIPFEYLILLKLKASRIQDLADCSKMLGAASNKTIQRTRDLIMKYCSNDIEDFEALVQLGQYENKI